MPYRHPQEGGGSLEILDEGISLTDKADSIDFVGAGVAATNVSDAVTATVGSGGRTSKDVVPTGTIDGANTSFTLPDTPSTDSLALFLNGSRLTAGGVHYSISGSTITYVQAPPSGSNHTARYEV